MSKLFGQAKNCLDRNGDGKKLHSSSPIFEISSQIVHRTFYSNDSKTQSMNQKNSRLKLFIK